jgi:hypothetical protein
VIVKKMANAACSHSQNFGSYVEDSQTAVTDVMVHVIRVPKRNDEEVG